MKISELIAKLAEIKAEHGDLECMLNPEYDVYYGIENLEVEDMSETSWDDTCIPEPMHTCILIGGY